MNIIKIKLIKLMKENLSPQEINELQSYNDINDITYNKIFYIKKTDNRHFELMNIYIYISKLIKHIKKNKNKVELFKYHKVFGSLMPEMSDSKSIYDLIEWFHITEKIPDEIQAETDEIMGMKEEWKVKYIFSINDDNTIILQIKWIDDDDDDDDTDDDNDSDDSEDNDTDDDSDEDDEDDEENNE